jgi:hypothetical protein
MGARIPSLVARGPTGFTGDGDAIFCTGMRAMIFYSAVVVATGCMAARATTI